MPESVHMNNWDEMISALRESVDILERAQAPSPYSLRLTASLYEESKSRKDEILAVTKQPVLVIKEFTDECFTIGDEPDNE